MVKVVTANNLARGTVVFLGANGAWIETIEQAIQFADTASAEMGLTAARLDEKKALVVEPFIVDRDDSKAGAGVMTLRNHIRAYGPTIDYRPAPRSGVA